MSGKSFFVKFCRFYEPVIGVGFKTKTVFIVAVWPVQFQIGWGYP